MRDRNRGLALAALSGVPVAIAIGAVASRLLLERAPQRLAIDLSQAVPVVTWWGSAGAPFLLALFATLALAYACYAFAARNDLPLRAILVACAAALCAGIFWLPLFSSDVYAYAAYGEMARLGLNPYVQHPGLNDALVRAAEWQWSGSLPPCVYGSGFVVIAAALVSVLHATAPLAQIESFRVLSCIALAACAYLLSTLGESRRGRSAALFFALNPVALWSAIEGHNDTAMLAIALAGIAVAKRHRAAGIAIASLSGLVKAPGILAGIGLAVRRKNARDVAMLAASLLVLLVASLPLIDAALHSVAPHGRYAPLASVQSLGVGVAGLTAILVFAYLRFARSPLDRWLTLALAAWLAIPNPYPWYSLWLLPVAAWSNDRTLRLATLAVTAASLLRYMPDAVAVAHGPGTVALGAVALLAYVPLLWRVIISRS